VITARQIRDCGVEASAAAGLAGRANAALAAPAPECWRRLASGVLEPEHPFALHRLLFTAAYAGWDATVRGPAPAWVPSPERIQESNLTRLMDATGFDGYAHLFAWAAEDRAGFWRTMAGRLGIRFRRKFDAVVDLKDGADNPRWFPGAEMNIVESCFQAPGGTPAVVSARESDPEGLAVLSYRDLERLTNRVANGLAAWGLRPGDAVAVDMPMTPLSVPIYLGLVAAGCVVVSIADSFAPHEIATRLRIAGAKAIFTQDHLPRGGKRLPLYAKVVEANAPRAVVLPSGGDAPVSLRPQDVRWDAFLSDDDAFTAVPRRPHDATNVLFSSGTTGDPKAIPWNQTTPLKCGADGHLHHDIRPGDVVAWPTNLGWMMGPWLIYASLLNRATVALFDGVPSGREFGRFVARAGVTLLGVVPALVRTWKNTECMKGLDWGAIRTFSSTGEPSNPEDMHFLMARAGYRPVIEYCGGTEIGGGYVTGTVIQPSVPAAFTTPALGLDLTILDDAGKPADNGEVFLVPPSVGLSTELLNQDHHAVYYAETPRVPGIPVPLRRHGDQLERLPGGFYRIHGRVDDTMNLGGIKVSSAEIERVLNGVEGVRETAAVAVSRPSKLIVFAVPRRARAAEALRADMQKAIRDHLNPLFRIHDVVLVDALPRTASNKVMRRVLRDRYDG
jgi:acetyl-CoA synthetase